MKTRLLSVRGEAECAMAAAEAARLWRAGEIVVVPTETVYGLAADALNPEGVAKIFEAKQRPTFNPLIVHLPDSEWLQRLTAPGAVTPLVEQLTKAYWPGPLTLVLPASPEVPELVRAGLPTVAVRRSSHPVLQRCMEEFHRPLAAPSANRFGRITPTTGRAALSELDGRVPLILDAGPSEGGLESTIVAVSGDGLSLLRSGPVTLEMLEPFGKVAIAAEEGSQPSAPGRLAAHYAPATPLVLCEHRKEVELKRHGKTGLLAWRPGPVAGFDKVVWLSEKGDLREAAANLFAGMRKLDESGLSLIIAERPPRQGLGLAINDRLNRAAAGAPPDGTVVPEN